MSLREIKLRNLTHLVRFQQELPTKYGEKATEAIQKLIKKTYNLRHNNLIDYIVTIMAYSESYPELRVLLPTENEINEISKAMKEKTKGPCREPSPS